MTLRPRIAIVSCVAALTSVGVTGALLIRQSRAYSEQDLLDRQTLLVENRAFALRDSVQVAANELTRLSHMAEVDLTDNDLRPEAMLLAHAHRNSVLFNIGMQIEDATGRCLWSEPASTECPGHSYADAPWFVAGRRASGPAAVGGPEPTVLNLVVPIGKKPGAADGVLRGIIDLRTDRIISPVLTRSLPPGTEVALLGGSREMMFPARLPDTPGWDRALTAVSGRGAGAFVMEQDGTRFVYAHAPVVHSMDPARPWGLVFRWPYRTLDVGLARQLRLLLILLALGGGLAVALGLLSSRFVTRPIEELLRAVRALMTTRGRSEAGPHATPEAARRSDELGELARAFAELRIQLTSGDDLHRQDLERIRELANSLEERVRARTAQLEAAQHSLVAQERLAAMGRAAAVISHELKNSLNALGMGFDLIALEADRLPQLARVNAQVRTEVNRLRAMVDDLLVFARTPRIDARPTDVNDLVLRTIELCAEQAASAGVAVSRNLSNGTLVVPCDPERIRSVLVNLVQNAIEAVAWLPPSERRDVLVTTAGAPAGEGFALVAVDDSGPGVSQDARSHLFEPFFTTKRNGTGLGLATAQRFVVAHGGRIELQPSPSLGGARFVVRLPADASTAASEAA